MPSLQMLLGHGGEPGVQVPDWHVSAPLQNIPSLHDVPFGCFASAGQLSDDPVQVSAISHAFAAGRQTVEVPSFASAGQAPPATPGQSSTASHGPAAGRQTVDEGWTTFGGHG